MTDDTLDEYSSEINPDEKDQVNHSADKYVAGHDVAASIVTARGTVEGLVIRIDGRVGEDKIEDALRDFVAERSKFLTGNEVAIEWIAVKPAEEFMNNVIKGIFSPYQVKIRSSRLKDAVKVVKSPLLPKEDDVFEFESDPLMSGFDDINNTIKDLDKNKSTAKIKHINTSAGKNSSRDTRGNLADQVSKSSIASEFSFTKGDVNLASDSALWDEPDARIVYATLRSGQRIESAHSIIIIGDVNSGAEVIAGGDIFVLGTLRGIAHAGAYDDDGGGRIIMAHTLLPTQLRIGSIISRGGGESGKITEIARVDGGNILVEPYQSRTAFLRGPRSA